MSEQTTGRAGAPGDTPGLPFEAWAEMSARLMNRTAEEQLDILAEHGVELADWRRCDELHLRVLATDAGTGRRDRLESYGRTCAAELARRRAAGSQVEAPPSPEPAVAPTPSPLEPAPGIVLEALAAGAPAVPSFLMETPGPAMPPAPAPKELAATAAAFDLPSVLRTGALPFTASARPSIPSAPLAPQMDAAPAAFTGTLPIGATLPVPVLPFPSVEATPGRHGAPPPLPLQTYASLCAELSVFPDRAALVLAQYGIEGEPSRAALEQQWEARFAAQPEMRREWQQKMAEFEGWLRRQVRA